MVKVIQVQGCAFYKISSKAEVKFLLFWFWGGLLLLFLLFKLDGIKKTFKLHEVIMDLHLPLQN